IAGQAVGEERVAERVPGGGPLQDTAHVSSAADTYFPVSEHDEEFKVPETGKYSQYSAPRRSVPPTVLAYDPRLYPPGPHPFFSEGIRHVAIDAHNNRYYGAPNDWPPRPSGPTSWRAERTTERVREEEKRRDGEEAQDNWNSEAEFWRFEWKSWNNDFPQGPAPPVLNCLPIFPKMPQYSMHFERPFPPPLPSDSPRHGTFCHARHGRSPHRSRARSQRQRSSSLDSDRSRTREERDLIKAMLPSLPKYDGRGGGFVLRQFVNQHVEYFALLGRKISEQIKLVVAGGHLTKDALDYWLHIKASPDLKCDS
ncbi:MAG: hypothetical protein BJ554DRAFT_209, partial [Olpidium bornovanus]